MVKQKPVVAVVVVEVPDEKQKEMHLDFVHEYHLLHNLK
jgi:hypothetical protein